MPIDAHMHYADDHPDFLALLAKFDLKFLNICFVAELDKPWRPQAELYRTMATAYPTRFSWCTSFDMPLFDAAFDAQRYADAAIQSLEADIAAGAIACKIWKNVGMEVRRPDGTYLLVDDPIFDPIYEYLTARDLTLLTHIAEPLDCWLPLRPGSPHYGYYSANPEWHMFGRTDVPSHGDLMAARDRVLEKHPALRHVGAHFGSLEYDLGEVGARLDRFPNFAVDISARLVDLVRHPADTVRAFFDHYRDRIIFGTDIVMRVRPSQMSEAQRLDALSALERSYQSHFAYFDTAGPVDVRGYAATGINLAPTILDRFYHENARVWYPGI
jgi:predicted TIM-barrel fold metal-dependent hydrolase